MAWEWVGPSGTVVVALAGIGATLRTAAQGRTHAERLASENHEQASQERRREERLQLYSHALAHAVDQERRLNAVWVSSGERHIQLSPTPAGGVPLLAAMDEVTVKMLLIAEDEVGEAWTAFVSAWERLHWWAANEHSGDPKESAPVDIETPLRASIEGLKNACMRSLNMLGDRRRRSCTQSRS